MALKNYWHQNDITMTPLGHYWHNNDTKMTLKWHIIDLPYYWILKSIPINRNWINRTDVDPIADAIPELPQNASGGGRLTLFTTSIFLYETSTTGSATTTTIKILQWGGGGEVGGVDGGRGEGEGLTVYFISPKNFPPIYLNEHSNMQIRLKISFPQLISDVAPPPPS